MFKNRIVIGMLALFAALLAVPVMASGDIDIDGEVRVRYENISNVQDAQDHPAGVDDDFDWYVYRARFAASGEFGDGVTGHVEVQNFGFFGNDNPFESANDPLGQGFQNSIDNSETQLYQAYVVLGEIGGSKWSVSVGRREHTFANELQMGDADFYNGITFDGVRVMHDGESFDLDLFTYQLVENGFPGDEDITFTGATAEIPLPGDNHVIRPYVLYLRDGDFDGAGGNLYTVGAQYSKDSDEGLDWNAEAAIQTGDFAPNGADLNYGGSIFEGWLGWNWGGNAHNRVHVGVLVASGDDDPTDTDLDAYVPLFTDPHANNRLGDLDLFGGPTVVSSLTGGVMTNITDLNVGYSRAWNDDKHQFRAAVHVLAMTEEDATGEDEIGQEIDLGYAFRYSDAVTLEAGVANLSAGDRLDLLVGSGGADDILRGWGQVRLRF